MPGIPVTGETLLLAAGGSSLVIASGTQTSTEGIAGAIASGIGDWNIERVNSGDFCWWS